MDPSRKEPLELVQVADVDLDRIKRVDVTSDQVGLRVLSWESASNHFISQTIYYKQLTFEVPARSLVG